jgi:hypothetical protein
MMSLFVIDVVLLFVCLTETMVVADAYCRPSVNARVTGIFHVRVPSLFCYT